MPKLTLIRHLVDDQTDSLKIGLFCGVLFNQGENLRHGGKRCGVGQNDGQGPLRGTQGLLQINGWPGGVSRMTMSNASGSKE